MSAEKLEMQKRKRLTVKDVFNNEDDKSEGRKGRPLVPLGTVPQFYLCCTLLVKLWCYIC